MDKVYGITGSIKKSYADFKARGVSLNLTRGKPSPAQLDLSTALLAMPGASDYMGEGATDCRNYGGLQGLVEARRLFAPMMGAPPDQIVVANNSSLALMHDVTLFSLIKGTCDGDAWAGEVAFLCPVPGYDRHFKICEDYGITMIPVPMHEDGPDMEVVERLAASDGRIKGMWCMPRYSNPTGAIYSSAVAERLASMKTAAPDFRLYWDNVYVVHHLTSERVEVANILELSAKAGHQNRPFTFASTSKITLAGAGLGMFAASKDNVKWLLARLQPRTIGPDKLNQLRHVRFLKDADGIAQLMDKHRAIIAPKFQKVLDVLAAMLGSLPGVSWTTPRGGYFITLYVPNGCARRVITLAKEAGIELTPAGSTYPLGADPDDRVIRIAPTFPELTEIAEAAEGVATCVLYAAAERQS